MLRFSLFGIPVVVQPWFWITLALLGGAINARDPEGMMRVVLFVLAGFISILVHELGHALTARRFGAYVGIQLHAFGGLASYSGVHMTRRQDFLITAGGPAIQLVLGGLVFLVFAVTPSLPPRIGLFLYFLMLVSVFWAIINLVPVIPLDGGQLMANLIGPGKRATALKISIASALIAALFLLKFTGFIFAIFLGLMAHQNWQELQHRQSRPW